MTNEKVDILAVDDDARNLLALEAVVADLPLNVVRARSGEEALRAVLAREFAVIVLDVQMPGMDGFEVARLLRGAERTRHIPIIFLTANSDLRGVATGYATGAVDYLFKPIVPELLRSKINVFVELARKSRLLIEAQAREHAQRLAEERARFEAELLRTKLEQEQATAEKLAAANVKLGAALEQARNALASRDEFLRMAAHELRTPITSMRLLVENALRKTAAPKSVEKMTRALSVADVQMNKLARLVEELLSVIVIEQGRLRLAPVDTDLCAVVRAAIDELEQISQQAGCGVELVSSEPVAGKCDPFWIRQAVGNLVTNACKYGGGAPVKVTVLRDGGRVRILVRDEGIGIDPSDQERIFEPYQRAESTDNYGGLGLGLHIARRIVEDHGGRVSVESAKGRGSTFTIELPG